MKIKISILLSSLFLFPLLSFSADLITPAEKLELDKGVMVKKIKWKKGYVWPEVTILTLLKHSPLDNLNIFLEFNDHKNYIPDMLKSKIIKKISPSQLHVYVEMSVPWPVKKSTHVTNNLVSHDPDGSHTLKWNLVKADMIKATDGYILFSPYEGKTLLKYVSLIVPNSSFAGLFKNRVATDVEKAVIEITKHLEKKINSQALPPK